jgi:hypothetical protein
MRLLLRCNLATNAHHRYLLLPLPYTYPTTHA